MNKILSICIPTYNMSKYLDINLKAITEVVEKYRLSDFIEICISDNASNDDTYEVIERYSKKKIHIIYSRNDKNIGADLNFLKVIELASGKYCWLLGADDVILEEGLLRALDIVKENKFEILLGDRINIDLNGKIIGNQYWYKEKLIVTRDNFYNFVKDANRLGAVFSYISSIIFRRNKWIEMTQKLNLNKFIGSCYIHSYILISMIKESSKMLYMHTPIVKNRVDNDSFLDNGYFNRIKIDFNYLDIFEDLFGISSKEYKSISYLLQKERTFLHFLKAKYLVRNDEFEKQLFKKFLKEKNIKKSFIIEMFPNFFIGFLLKIYKNSPFLRVYFKNR